MTEGKEQTEIKEEEMTEKTQETKNISEGTNTNTENIEEEKKETIKEETVQNISEEFTTLVSKLKLKAESIFPEEFEKDNDQNYHIDAIYSLTNCRALNYKLDAMDWMTVKIKAGRIIPALATTTASIAGLQTAEFVKIIKNIKLEDMKNAFLNIAVPILTQSEPGPMPQIEIHKDLKVTLWDRWDILDAFKNKLTLKKMFEIVREKYNVWVKDIFKGAMPVYSSAIGDKQILESPLCEVLQLEEKAHVDLTIACTLQENGVDIIQNIPNLRVFY